MSIDVKFKCFFCHTEHFYTFENNEDVEDSIKDYCEECKDNVDFMPIEIVSSTKQITFKCIKCGGTFERSKIPLVVVQDKPKDAFEASRVCVECLDYCRNHGLKLQTLTEYEEQRRGL